MPMKAPAYFAPYNWTGFYVGINGGGGWGNSDWTARSARTGSFDILADWSAARSATTGKWPVSSGSRATSIGATSRAARPSAPAWRAKPEHWLGTVRVRIGYAFDRFLPYVTGGLAFGDVKTR